MHAYFRSNDMFRAWPANMFSIAKLAEYVASRLTEESGIEYRVAIAATLSASAHVYDRDVEEARRVVDENWRLTYSRDVYDPRGSFVIGNDSVSHYTSDGMLWRLVKADRAFMRREASKLMPDHAFYIGEEWAAKVLLGSKYRQEEWRV